MWAQISWPPVLIGAVCQTLVISLLLGSVFIFPCMWAKSGGWLLGMSEWMDGNGWRVGEWRRFGMVSLYVSEGLKTLLWYGACGICSGCIAAVLG